VRVENYSDESCAGDGNAMHVAFWGVKYSLGTAGACCGLAGF